MRKSLNLLAAAALLAALGACNRPPAGAGGVTPEEESKLDNAAGMLNDQIDTSADDMALNAEEAPAEENAPAAAGNGAVANQAGNRQ